MKKKVNLSLDIELHAKARIYARKHSHSNLSNLMTQLLVDELRRNLSRAEVEEMDAILSRAETSFNEYSSESPAGGKLTGKSVADLLVGPTGPARGKRPTAQKTGRAVPRKTARRQS